MPGAYGVQWNFPALPTVVGTMGGYYDEVRGRSKIETYLALVRKLGGDVRALEGTWDPRPWDKKACKAAMVQDPTTEEWVLGFHWHS